MLLFSGSHRFRWEVHHHPCCSYVYNGGGCFSDFFQCFLFSFDFQQFPCHVHRGSFLYINHALDSLRFLDIKVDIFTKFKSFLKYSYLFHSLFFWDKITHNVRFFYIVLQVIEVLLIFEKSLPCLQIYLFLLI